MNTTPGEILASTLVSGCIFIKAYTTTITGLPAITLVPILRRYLAAASILLIAVKFLHPQTMAVPVQYSHQSEEQQEMDISSKQTGGQGDTVSTESSMMTPAQYQRGISGRWQTRLGISSLADRGYLSLPFAWELPKQLSLRGIQLQPAIAWGYLHRSEDRDEHHPEYEEFTDYYEDILYGMFEVHKQWRTWQGRLGGSLHTGFGLGYSVEQYYNLFEEIQEWEKGVAWIASAGIQLEAKIPELPTMVSDVRFYHTPNYGTSYVVSYGIRGNLLHVVGAWGLIIATYILLEG